MMVGNTIFYGFLCFRRVTHKACEWSGSRKQSQPENQVSVNRVEVGLEKIFRSRSRVGAFFFSVDLGICVEYFLSRISIYVTT